MYGHAGGLGGGNMRERGVMDEGLQKGGRREPKGSPFCTAEAADGFGEGDQSRTGAEVRVFSQGGGVEGRWGVGGRPRDGPGAGAGTGSIEACGYDCLSGSVVQRGEDGTSGVVQSQAAGVNGKQPGMEDLLEELHSRTYDHGPICEDYKGS